MDLEHVPSCQLLTLNISQTQYSVVSNVGRELGWRLSQSWKEDWDMCWLDSGMTPERLIRMRPYQRINHYPGMHSLSQKNHLAVNLQDMQEALPSEYDFFPQTWLLPKSYGDLKRAMEEGKNAFIVKPEAESQGRGIFLTKSIEKIPLGSRCVVQRYIEHPFLLDGLKFDLRIYVLVTGSDPIHIYIHEEGLARFATLPYKRPKEGNLSATWMHLTNYAINKTNPGFVFNTEAEKDDIGHKRSLKSVFSRLSSQGHNSLSLWNSITSLITKTMLSVHPLLTHIYHSCQPNTPNLCFELLGFDILLDQNLKPWLLEVNHSPSFNTDSPLDEKVKKKVISDVFGVLAVSQRERRRYYEGLRERSVQTLVLDRTPGLRLLTPWNSRLAEIRQKPPILGGFQLIYPISSGSDPYLPCLEAANRIYQSRMPKPHVTRDLMALSLTPIRRMPATRAETGEEEPRRLSFSNKRPIKVPSASYVGLDSSFLRPIVLRSLPKGAYLRPKYLRFRSTDSEASKPITHIKHILRIKHVVKT